MRALAILLVVFSHAVWILPNSRSTISDLMNMAGLIGVEIFFVLSGFLIGRIIYRLFVKEDFSFKKMQYFWIRRWFRTLPNYYLVLLFNILMAGYIGINLPNNLGSYFLFLQNFTTEMPGFFGESWSLPIEEFAYIIGPLLLYLVLFLKFKMSKKYLFLLVTLLIITVFIVTKIVYNVNDEVKNLIHWNVNLKAMTIYRIDAIYYGVLAAWLSFNYQVSWKKHKWLFLFLAGIIFIGMNVVISMKQILIETHSYFWNILYLPLNSLAITLTLPLLSQMKSASRAILKPVTFISIISYSMYLLHYSVILQWLKYKVPTDNLTQIEVVAYVAIYFILTILLSYALYRFFEKPMTNLRDSEFIRKRFDT